MMVTPTETTRPTGSRGFRNVLRLLAGPAFILICLVVAGRFAGRFWPQVETAAGSLGFQGYLLFATALVLLSLTCFPLSVMGISAGALFGPWKGMALVFLASMVAGSVMYWLGRGFFRDRIIKMIVGRPKLAAVDRLAQKQAWKLNVLTRLSFLNFGLASYTLASGPTPFRLYFWGMFAILPSTMAQVWFGALAGVVGPGSETEGFSLGRTGLIIGGLVFFLLLTWMIGRMIKRSWEETLLQDQNS